VDESLMQKLKKTRFTFYFDFTANVFETKRSNHCSYEIQLLL